MRSAVLLLLYNRPYQTKRLFDTIKAVKPKRLYLSIDGPKQDNTRDTELVEEVKDIVSDVNWECNIFKLYRRKNYGCKYAVPAGINWFFQNEKEGIILEDDCIPAKDFFAYCDWALEKFRESKRVMHINGNNFAADANLYNNEINFVSLAQAWGWATWADTWTQFQLNPFYLAEQISITQWMLSPLAKLSKLADLEHLKHGLDTWDYQWQITVLNRNGLAVSCKQNLISNIGFGKTATHTLKKDARMELTTGKFKGLRCSPSLTINNELNLYYEKKMGLTSLQKIASYLLSKTKIYSFNVFKKLCCYLLFANCKPIIIASTGRAGSQMLTESISLSLTKSRYSCLPVKVQIFISKLAIQYCNKIDSDMRKYRCPVIKTHDLYSDQFNSDYRFIFLFTDRLTSSISVAYQGKKHGLIWIEKHIYHLQGKGNPHDLFKKDILNHEEQIKSWRKSPGLKLDYSVIWDEVDQISNYLGFTIDLPPKIKRRSQYEQATSTHLI